MRQGLRRAAPRLALAWVLAQTGCAAAPAPPADRFWRLAPSFADTSARPAPLLDGTLGVERLRAPGLVGERALLWSRAGQPHELRASAFQHWVEPPADQIQELLLAYLAARGVASAVQTPEMRQRPDWFVSGRLLRFERVVGDGAPRALVELRLALVQRAGERQVWGETYREEVASEGSEVAQAVAAFDAALRAAFARFDADLERHAASVAEAGRGDAP